MYEIKFWGFFKIFSLNSDTLLFSTEPLDPKFHLYSFKANAIIKTVKCKYSILNICKYNDGLIYILDGKNIYNLNLKEGAFYKLNKWFIYEPHALICYNKNIIISNNGLNMIFLKQDRYNPKIFYILINLLKLIFLLLFLDNCLKIAKLDMLNKIYFKFIIVLILMKKRFLENSLYSIYIEYKRFGQINALIFIILILFLLLFIYSLLLLFSPKIKVGIFIIILIVYIYSENK